MKTKQTKNETSCCGPECCSETETSDSVEFKTDREIKEMIKQKYSNIALQSKESHQNTCCGTDCCTDEASNIMNEEYISLEGYNPEADLGLGCGLPTQFADIKKGDTVVDLGSGAGNDCFIARAETGETGKVIGVDFSEAMIIKARENSEKLGFNNIEFRLGEIESLPVSENHVDVVISNCVLNLVPDKSNAFKEIFRVLKPGGHFSISDIILSGDLPEKIKKAGEMYAGCVSGAITKENYLGLIEKAGFIDVKVQKQRDITLPNDILSNHLSESEIREYNNGDSRVLSITVFGVKP